MNKKMQQFCDKKDKQPDYYSEISIRNIQKPITVLLGPNGTGKSMSMKHIENQLKRQKINCIIYSTSHDDIVQKGAPAFGDWDPYKLSCAFHSEGERMIDSFFDWANTIMLREIMTNKKPLWVLVDEADSGLSFDRLMQSIIQIVHIIRMEVEKDRNIHIIFSCNSYEMVECLRSPYTDFIWVPTKQHIKVGSYMNFKKKYIDYYDRMFNDEEETEDVQGNEELYS